MERRSGIRVFEERLTDLFKTRNEKIKEIEELKNYNGGDPTAPEYVIGIEIFGLEADIKRIDYEINEAYKNICALKMKLLHAVFCGADANQKFFSDAVVGFVVENILNNFNEKDNISLSRLNFVLDGGKDRNIKIDKRHHCINIEGTAISGDDFNYQINFLAKGIELVQITNENEKNG